MINTGSKMYGMFIHYLEEIGSKILIESCHEVPNKMKIIMSPEIYDLLVICDNQYVKDATCKTLFGTTTKMSDKDFAEHIKKSLLKPRDALFISMANGKFYETLRREIACAQKAYREKT